MANKRHKNKGKDNGCVIRARTEPALKTRLTQYRTRPEVSRSEGFVVREALKAFLDARMPETADTSK